MGAKASEHPAVRFGVIGINHNHIYGITDLLLRAGAQLASFFAPEPELAAEYGSKYPQARQARSALEVLEDESIALIACAAIPADRAAIGIVAMQHGKDVISDKPGFTTLGQLAEARRVQAVTGRIYSICYSERLEVRAAVKAGELVQAGAIGKVVQTVGLGPHRMHPPARPDWFYQKERFGGILTDIASHQADQFLFYTGSTTAGVVAAQVANVAHPQHPELEDFGDMVLRGDGGTGYVRVDWFTPQGLGVWGDGRLTILGTEGYIELRKYIDIAGRPGGDHLFLVDGKGIQYIDCRGEDLPYGRQLLSDVVHRTETAMAQAHCFLASQLVLEAQQMADRARSVAEGSTAQ
jgi:predicted dehydrogenase